MRHKGLNQLLAAALINERFREMLLSHPARAIASGYSGQTFLLTAQEQDLVLGIRAGRLEDFAAEISLWIANNGCDGSLGAASHPLGTPRMAAGYSEPALDLAPMAAAV